MAESTSPGYRINAPSVVSQTIDQETIIINFDTGVYYSTNETGAAIWSLIEQRATCCRIVDCLRRTYTPDGVSIGDSVARFIEDLRREELIVVSDATSETDTATVPEAAKDPPTFSAPVLERYNDMADLLLLDPVHEIEDRARQDGRNPAP